MEVKFNEVSSEYATAYSQKEVSLGEQIFNLIDGVSPKERRQALQEAEKLCHAMFERKIKEQQEMLQSLQKSHDEFKQG